MTDYTTFRPRLDAALRTLDVKQVQDFLIAEGQWSPGTPADPEFAMWMMIAASSTLNNLHGRAREWLLSHGHVEETQAVLGKNRSQQGAANKQGKRPARAQGGAQVVRQRGGQAQKPVGKKRPAQ